MTTDEKIDFIIAETAKAWGVPQVTLTRPGKAQSRSARYARMTAITAVYMACPEVSQAQISDAFGVHRSMVTYSMREFCANRKFIRIVPQLVKLLDSMPEIEPDELEDAFS